MIRIVGDLVLHFSNSIGLLIDTLDFVIELLLLLEVPHLVTVCFVLELLGAILLGEKRLPELANLLHDIECAQLWVLLYYRWPSLFDEDHVGGEALLWLLQGR
jgi:hypothetical protein